MKLPFVKRSAVRDLQRKLDASRATVRKKDQQVKTAQTKTRAAREKAHALQAQLDEARKDLQTLQWQIAAGQIPLREGLVGLLTSMDGREILSLRFLRGQGVEVGALHRPTKTAPGTITKFYDYVSGEENRKRYHDLLEQGYTIVDTDYIGSGEKLELIEDDSQDYIIANHMLEHCQDVIGTLKIFWRKLRMGGALLISLPDKRYTFDFRRPRTPFEHLVRDYLEGPRGSLFQHYTEFHELAITGCNYSKTEAEVLDMPHVDVHFHVWTQADIIEMFLRLGTEHGFNWEIDGMFRQHIEVVTLLRKEEVQLWDRSKPETNPGKTKSG